MAEIKEMSLDSEDLVDGRLAQLKEMLPEAFTESGVDFDKLRLLLGDEIDEGQERYAFTWPGKADAIRQSQTPSTATLRPCMEKSRGRDGDDGGFDSDNIYIEGDNLEVLKLLQRGYHGKVKMIYIDPPYNTGNDFVYKDRFSDTIENYKEQAGLASQSNADTSGRYHSDWCSMMYPRLKLCRELLSDEGIIFVSIDYNENFNARIILNELFGSDSFVGEICWESKTKSQNTTTSFDRLQPKVESILVYAKGDRKVHFNLIATGEKEYSHSDERGEYREHVLELMNANGVRGRATMVFGISDEVSTVFPPEGRQWQLGQDQVATFKERGDLFIRDGKVILKMRPNDERSEKTEPFWGFFDKTIGTAESAKKELKQLLGSHGFETVKPVELIKRLCYHATNLGDVVVDFFSGSATTAHAVMRQNLDDGGNRKYILVQLPEICSDDSETSRSGYKNICEVGEERIRRAGDKIKAELEGSNRQLKMDEEPKSLPDIGFRVFALDDSCIEKPEPGQLLLDVVKPDRSDLDIVFEMMLKWGLELTLPVEEEDAAGYPIYSVAYGELVCCLADGLTMEALDAIADMEPRRVLMRDSILTDALKLNAIQAFKRVEKKTGREVELRTV